MLNSKKVEQKQTVYIGIMAPLRVYPCLSMVQSKNCCHAEQEKFEWTYYYRCAHCEVMYTSQPKTP